MTSAMVDAIRRSRAASFRYESLDVTADSLVARYTLDGRPFTEEVVFEGVGTLARPEVRAVAELWFLVAGLSYYKAGAAHTIDVGATPLGASGTRLLRAALVDGLGEFSVRNNLPLDDVEIVGGTDPTRTPYSGRSLLVPFGGGIDSIVTVTEVAEQHDAALFVVSPGLGRFAPLEASAAVTGRPVIRATRRLDAEIVRRNPAHFQGHVPVTAMITLLATVAAIAGDRAGVVMSNEHSASVPNGHWRDRSVNHQWSKSLEAEELLAAAVAERVGDDLVIASALRDRSELWVARAFSAIPQYHSTFRSCNRAFTHDPQARAATWCGECDKCLFIDLVLAPFIERTALSAALGVEPLSDRARSEQLQTLVGLGATPKPFECVGDPTECSVALVAVAGDESWRAVEPVTSVASSLPPTPPLATMWERQGTSRAPTTWFR